MQAIERQETKKTIINEGILYEIFYDGHKRRAAIQGLQKKGLRRIWNMRMEAAAREYNV